MSTNTISFTADAFKAHPRPRVGEKPITRRRDGARHQQVTFYANTISLSIAKSFKGQRFNQVIGHWPAMSISVFEKLANERLAQIEQGYYNKASSILVGDFFIDYVLPMMKTHNRDIQSVKTRWRRLAGDIAHLSLGDVSRLDITQILTRLATEVKGSTVNRHLSLLSRIFSIAVELELLHRNPCKGIKKWPESNIRDRVLSDTELFHYIDKALEIGSFHAKALLVSLFLGLRISNVISISKEMINHDFTILSLPQTKNGRAYRIAINEPARKLLTECAVITWNTWLFPSALHEDQHIASPRACHAKIREHVALTTGCHEHLVIHDLRRTYASRQLALTGDARLVQQNLFHQSVTTTERYAFHSDQSLTQASQDTASSLISGHSQSFNLHQG
ncbi:tyrosine-type recombinase/integrase [Vibrio atlanticus]|nr:tyrosine-type recombinase/integrase [Vibrio atlanticus]